MIEYSDDITKLAPALHAMQSEVHGVPKDGKNPHFKNRYATLENVIETAKPALQAHGLAFVQAPGMIVNGAVEITTVLMHTSGQWMRSTLHVPLSKMDPQGVGSAITYGCRYSLMAMLGLPPVDDDGEATRTSSEPRRSTAPHRLEPQPPQLKGPLEHALDAPTESQVRIYEEATAAIVREKTLAGVDAACALHKPAVKDCTDDQWNNWIALVKTRRAAFAAFPGDQAAQQRTRA